MMSFNRNLYYILKGRCIFPCKDIYEFIALGKNVVRHKQVDDTYLYECRVSTVFLGVNHQYCDGPPLVFETMIFGGKHDGLIMRYPTYPEAERGHRAIVKLIKLARPLSLTILFKLLYIK